jgi:hypothetical protein
MRTLYFALVASLLLALGCRSNNGQVLVEQEARMLEDEVYHLEARLDECCRSLEAARHENEDLRKQLGKDGAADSGATGGDYRAPAVELPGRDPTRPDGPRLEPPSIELPEPSDTPPANLLPGDQQPSAVHGQPTKLSINKRLTGGLDRDATGGDEGIMVMVEPRDERGRLVSGPGAVSVVVMDPAQVGDASRVARWDFQTHEFDDHFKKSTFCEGQQYELEWPGEPPTNRDLVLFVRYIGDDGTKLTSDAPLTVRMPSDSPRVVRASAEDTDEPRSQVRRSRPSRQARAGRPEWKPYR